MGVLSFAIVENGVEVTEACSGKTMGEVGGKKPKFPPFFGEAAKKHAFLAPTLTLHTMHSSQIKYVT